MSDAARLLAALLVATAAVGGLAAAAGDARADHGGEANYTVVPRDRQPGSDDATYSQFAVSPRDVDYLDYIAATWYDGGFTGCGPSNAEVFGIDRGNTHDGHGIDEDLKEHVEESETGEDHFRADFYERDDAVGSSTHMNEGDQFVGYVKDCFDNPDEPGWYRIESSVGGWTEDDEYVRRNTTSHYFAVCDCENEQEAREQLGPPPSEEGSGGGDGGGGDSSRSDGNDGGGGSDDSSGDTGGDGNADGGDGTGGSDGGGGASDANDGRTGTAETPPPTDAGGGDDASDGDTGGGDDGDGSDGTADPGGDRDTDGDDGDAATGASGDETANESWNDYVRRTPTEAAGPGVGPAGALAAALAGALVALRRSG